MAWECPKCKHRLGAIHFGAGARSLEYYFFPCYECELLVTGSDKAIENKAMTEGFFRIKEILRKALHMDEIEYREESISGVVESFFHLAWWGKLKFTPELIEAVALIAMEDYTGIIAGSLSKKVLKMKAELLDAREKVSEYHKTHKIPEKYERFVRY